MIETTALIEKFQYALSNAWGYIWGTAGVMWTEAKQKALEQTTDKDREMGRKYGRKWIGHYVADCSGLFSWAFKELGGYMFHGSNTMYNQYCTHKGTFKNGKRTDGQELKPGAAVFTGNSSNKGHVGLYIGNGYVIEAQGTKAGVVRSSVTLNKWTYWGELKGVNYGDSPAPAPTPEPTPDTKPTLRRGDKGAYVTLAQTELINKGYSCGSFGADGEFGKATETAVKAFQREHTDESGKPLVIDGVIGKKTWAALDAPDAPIKYTVTILHLSKAQAEALISEYPGSTMTPERG